MERERAVSNLQTLIRIPTITITDETDADFSAHIAFIDELPALYPALHAVLERELVAGYSLLYRWPGASSEAPVVLMAHYDVVPATVEGWEHAPFSADIVGDTIWGRGTLDDKGSLVAAMEAVEALVTDGFTPPRDVYLSFGHNEESYGSGAASIVDLLESRGIRPGLVIDEGGAIVEGIFPGVTAPVAVVGVTEKGVTTVSLAVDQLGGHASMPPRMTATVRLARAIQRLNDKPFPARMSSPIFEMVRVLGNNSAGLPKLIFSNLWLTRPLIAPLFGRLGVETRAMTRTTAAVTQLSGSMASNALAERATATVNVRVAVGSSVAESVSHIRAAIRDELVTVSVESPSEPSPVSPTRGTAWDAIRSAVTAAYPGTVVSPYIMFAASDARHFTRISDHVYRFSPFLMSKGERGTLHAKNERMRVSTFLDGIGFYETLLRTYR
jgi:carboxypeptidase PM20D1